MQYMNFSICPYIRSKNGQYENMNKEVYDVVFNADGERITVSVSMVEFNVLKEGDQGKLVLADHEIESFGDILGTK